LLEFDGAKEEWGWGCGGRFWVPGDEVEDFEDGSAGVYFFLRVMWLN